MSERSPHCLTVPGKHRHWTILERWGGTQWQVLAEPLPSAENPARRTSPTDTFPDLTAAYDAYVRAEYADNEESYD